MPSANGSTTTDPVEKATVDFREVGSSGLNMVGGEVHDEPLRQLRGSQGRDTLRQMSDNDSVVGAVLFAISMLFRQGEWPIEPHPDDTSDDLVEFVNGALHDMEQPFSDHISAAASMLVYGWSFHEQVFKRRNGLQLEGKAPPSQFEDGMIGWRGWPLRSQQTLLRWEEDPKTGRFSMVQNAPPSYRSVLIPWQRALHYRTTGARGSPEGASALRNAYRDWYYKTRIQEVEGIGIERDLAGLPVGRVPVEYLSDNGTPQQKAAADEFKKILRNIRRDDQAAILWPQAFDERGNKLFDLELLSSGGQRQIDTSEVIARYDQRIAMTVLADFILLGHQKIGTQALSRSKIDIFTSAIMAWMDTIAETINRDAIPRLLQVNGMNARLSPRLRPTGVKQVDLEELGKYVSELAGSGMPLFPDVDLQNYLRETGGLPPEPAEFEMAPPAPPTDDAEDDDAA